MTSTSFPFTRPDPATYTDINGAIQTAAINVLRNQYYINGILQAPLMELASKNLLLRSEDISNATWTKSGAPIIATDSLTAPDNTLTMDAITRSANTNTFLQQPVAGIGVGIQLTYSTYAAAKATGNRVALRLLSTYPVRADAVFDLASGTLIGTARNTYTGLSTSIIPVFGFAGIYRISLTAITPQTFTGVECGPTDSTLGTGSWEGASAVLSDCYLWGHQLEIGPGATSYIKTVATQVSRGADSDQMLSALVNGYARQQGDFIQDGFTRGQTITPVGFNSNPTSIITNVFPKSILVSDLRQPETAQAGRSLSAIATATRGIGTFGTGYDTLDLTAFPENIPGSINVP